MLYLYPSWYISDKQCISMHTYIHRYVFLNIQVYYINILWSTGKKNRLQSKYFFYALNIHLLINHSNTGNNGAYSLMETNSLICGLKKRVVFIESLISFFIILNSFVNCWEFMSFRSVGVKLDVLPYVFIHVDASVKSICVLWVFFKTSLIFLNLKWFF